MITRPIAAVWVPVVEKPWNKLSYPIRLGLGVLALLALIFGSGFGFKLQEVIAFLLHTMLIADVYLQRVQRMVTERSPSLASSSSKLRSTWLLPAGKISPG